MNKPRIRMSRPEFCPHCGKNLQEDHVYTFQWRNSTEFSRSFAGICKIAAIYTQRNQDSLS